VAKILPGTDPVHKVTIIPRGRALGLTQQLPMEDRLNINQEFALNQIAILMGLAGITPAEPPGRERHQVATNWPFHGLQWGMSEKMGPLAFGKKEGEVFLGRDMASVQTYSEQTAREIDAEVRRIVTEQYDKAKKVLLENREMMNKIADALLEYETIDASDIDTLMAGGTINRPPPTRPSAPAATGGEKQERAKKPGLLDTIPVPKVEPGMA
jgi:cell division protease FtsH